MQVVWVVVFLVLGVSADPKMRDIEGLIDHTVTDSPTEPFDIIVDTEDTKLTEDEYFLFQENIRQFGNEVFSKITQSNPNENVFFSPSSISISLAILMLGSEGETQENLIRTLHLDQLSMPKIATAFLLLITDIYHSDSEVTIHMTNQLWSEVELWDSFISMSKEFFHSHLEQISFQDPELVRERINQEIAKLTNDKILDLLPPGSIDRQTILVITNAIYFKGDWHHVFNEEQTKDDFFTLHSGEQVTVPMMNIEKSFRYAYEDGIHVVEIPYEGKEFSMVVYYPDDAKEFDFTSIPEISLSELKLTVLALSMPKFRVETKVQLKEMLKDMGLEILFGNGCDLSGITPRTNQLEVDEIYHQAFVEVNEQGTEAAAATAVVILERAMFMPSTSLALNHPFIFEIINTNTEHAVFSGLLNNPLSG